MSGFSMGSEETPDLQSIGGRIRYARRMQELTCNEVDRRAEFGEGTTSRFENGRRGKTPEAETMLKFAKVLHVRLEWLLRREGPDPRPLPKGA